MEITRERAVPASASSSLNHSSSPVPTIGQLSPRRQTDSLSQNANRIELLQDSSQHQQQQQQQPIDISEFDTLAISSRASAPSDAQLHQPDHEPQSDARSDPIDPTAAAHLDSMQQRYPHLDFSDHQPQPQQRQSSPLRSVASSPQQAVHSPQPLQVDDAADESRGYIADPKADSGMRLAPAGMKTISCESCTLLCAYEPGKQRVVCPCCSKTTLVAASASPQPQQQPQVQQTHSQSQFSFQSAPPQLRSPAPSHVALNNQPAYPRLNSAPQQAAPMQALTPTSAPLQLLCYRCHQALLYLPTNTIIQCPACNTQQATPIFQQQQQQQQQQQTRPLPLIPVNPRVQSYTMQPVNYRQPNPLLYPASQYAQQQNQQQQFGTVLVQTPIARPVSQQVFGAQQPPIQRAPEPRVQPRAARGDYSSTGSSEPVQGRSSQPSPGDQIEAPNNSSSGGVLSSLTSRLPTALTGVFGSNSSGGRHTVAAQQRSNEANSDLDPRSDAAYAPLLDNDDNQSQQQQQPRR